jgi:YggT family protein
VVAALLAASVVAELVCTLLLLYLIVIFGSIALSWFPLEPGGAAESVWRVLRTLTDPVLEPLRRLIPPIGGVIDISPIVVIVAISVLRGIVCGA